MATPKIRRGPGLRMMKGNPYKGYGGGGFYSPMPTSCYGECHPTEAPCDGADCLCTGGSSGGNWWGTCSPARPVGPSPK